jgi:alpha-methylacyl-CoA racemase
MSAAGAEGRAAGPLAGVRVVELAGMGVVPYAAMVLADLGADVIRVDRVAGDPLESPSNQYRGRPTDFLVRRGRRSIALDLKAAGGPEVLMRLVSGADGLFEGFRPGVAERLGIGPAQCHQRNPRLVYVRATGWGQDGPYAQSPGHDLNYVALSGALLAMGRRDSPPPPPLNLVGDFAGGALFAVIGFLSALLPARLSGVGQVIDASMIDGVAHLTTLYHGMLANGAWTERRESNLLDGGSPLYDVYETADGGYMSVAAGEPAFVSALMETLGVASQLRHVDLRERQQWPTVRAALAAAFKSKTRQEWTDLLAGRADQCCAPVLSFGEAPANEHSRARQIYLERDGVVQPVPAPRFATTPATLGLPPPRPGEHTVAVLAECGYQSSEIDELVATATVLQSASGVRPEANRVGRPET